MSSTTLEDVWALFREVAEAQKETERRFQETERLLKAQSQEAERRSQEAERRSQETERLLKAQSQEAERLLKAQSQETDRAIREVNKRIGELGGQWGLFVENMVAPACETVFAQRGIPVHMVSQRVRKRRGGDTLEIDVLVVNEGHVVMVEVKSSMSVADVQEFLTNLARFRTFFPEYADKRLHGAVAGMRIEEGADRYAYRLGLFVLAQTGDSVGILNDDNFQPKSW